MFRKKLVDHYELTNYDEAEKFRTLWIEDREKLDGVEQEGARE